MYKIFFPTLNKKHKRNQYDSTVGVDIGAWQINCIAATKISSCQVYPIRKLELNS